MIVKDYFILIGKFFISKSPFFFIALCFDSNTPVTNVHCFPNWILKMIHNQAYSSVIKKFFKKLNTNFLH